MTSNWKNTLCCLILVFLIKSACVDGSFEKKPSNCPSGVDVTVQLEEPLCIYEEETVSYKWNCSCFNNASFIEVSANQDSDPKYSFIKNGGHISAEADNSKVVCKHGVYSIPITARYLGEMIFDIDSADNVGKQNFTVKVCRKQTLVETVMFFVLSPLVLINKFAFGAKIELDSLKVYLLKPKELGLCFFVQFVFLPLMAIMWGHIFRLSSVSILSLLVAAVCPGGGGGYVFSYLIDGDITLAIAASLFSTLFAMAAMPAVIAVYIAVAGVSHSIYIPYMKILLILIMIVIPISSGMLLRYKRPDWAKKLVQIIRPLSLFLIVVGSVVLVFMSRYVVVYGPWEGYALAFIIPLSGFLAAIALSKLFGFDWAKAKAISLESGMKNTLLGVAVIEISFPQPTADLASVIILMVTAGQTALCVLWYVVYLVKSKLFENKETLKVTFGRDKSEDTVAFLSSHNYA